MTRRQPTLLVIALVGVTILADPIWLECRPCCPGEGASALVASSLGCCGDNCARPLSGEKPPELASATSNVPDLTLRDRDEILARELVLVLTSSRTA